MKVQSRSFNVVCGGGVSALCFYYSGGSQHLGRLCVRLPPHLDRKHTRSTFWNQYDPAGKYALGSWYTRAARCTRISPTETNLAGSGEKPLPQPGSQVCESRQQRPGFVCFLLSFGELLMPAASLLSPLPTVPDLSWDILLKRTKGLDLVHMFSPMSAILWRRRGGRSQERGPVYLELSCSETE